MPAELRWTPAQIQARLDEKDVARARMPTYLISNWITITVEPTKPVRAGIRSIRVAWFGYCSVELELDDGTIDVWVREGDLREYLRRLVLGKEAV